MSSQTIASVIMASMVLYAMRNQQGSTQVGLAAVVGAETYYALNRSEQNEGVATTKHVDIDPKTGCSYQDVTHSGGTYACMM